MTAMRGCSVDMDSGGLQSGLKRRHVTMISLGGVIGAGLFVGSGAVINKTGPAAVLSYLAAGVLVILVMRMLGEMAVANPIPAAAQVMNAIVLTAVLSCLNSGLYVASR